jgi:hypothetical protein
MCPYCGEEVPNDSAKCWKCGTELSEGGAKAPADGDDLEVPDDDDEDGGKGPQTIECPHCGSEAPKKAQRCKECGRALREVKTSHGAAAWKLGVWALVLGGGLAITVAVVVYSVRRRGDAERAKVIAVTFENLKDKVKPLQRTNEERRRDVWNREFDRKFVRWTGVVVQRDPDQELRLQISQTKGMKDKTDVIVDFDDDSREALSGLKVGDTIVYSARLVEFGHDKDTVAFRLANGRIEEKP